MKKSFFNSPALALALAFIAPIFFVFSQNWHRLDPRAMLAASGITIFLACAVFLCASLGIRFWKKNSADAPRRLQWLVAAGFLAILVETCCFFLQTQLFAAIHDPRWLRIALSRVFPFFMLLALVRKFGFYPLNVFLAVFLSFSIVGIGRLALLEEQSIIQDQAGVEAPAPAAYELKNRPNIYLFFLESYHSLDVQRNVYGIDTKEFESYLAGSGFVDYGKIYSNSPSTLSSFADIFLLRSGRAYARGLDDAGYAVRRMLGGSKDNALFRHLKANGYTTVFLVRESGSFGSIRGELLDDSDDFFPERPYPSAIDVARCFQMLNTRFGDNSLLELRRYYYFFHDEMRYKGSFEDRVSQAVAMYAHPGASPFFVTFKGGAGHTPPDGSYTWRKHEDFVRSGSYQRSIKACTQELRRVCDGIIAADPGALIILIGDHAPRRFRWVEEGSASLPDLMTRLRAKNISFQDWVDDIHGVFLAIRLPHGLCEDISYGLPMSHVNIFRHVFAYLGADKSILETREPSNSYWGGFAIVNEGAPVAGP